MPQINPSDLFIKQIKHINMQQDFNTLYEVISDTQEGWREKADSIVGYVNGSLDALSQYMSMEGILKVNEMQEQNKKAMLDGFTQAYKQGQADAYGESASVARDTKKQYKENKFGDNFLYDGGFIGACEEITQELARQREEMVDIVKQYRKDLIKEYSSSEPCLFAVDEIINLIKEK